MPSSPISPSPSSPPHAAGGHGWLRGVLVVGDRRRVGDPLTAVACAGQHGRSRRTTREALPPCDSGRHPGHRARWYRVAATAGEVPASRDVVRGLRPLGLAQQHESSGDGRRCPPRVRPPGCPNAAITRGRVCHSTPGEGRPWPDASRRARPPLWRSLLRRSLLGPRCGRCATRGQLRLIFQGGAAGDVQRGAQRRRPLSGVLTQLANVLGVLGAQRLALGLGLLAGPLDRLARFSGDQLISLHGLLGGRARRLGRGGRAVRRAHDLARGLHLLVAIEVLACRNVSAASADCNPEFATCGEKKRR